MFNVYYEASVIIYFQTIFIETGEYKVVTDELLVI